MGNLANEFVSDMKLKQRVEIIEGNMYMQARPSPAHGDVVRNITLLFGNYLKGKPCKVYNDVKVEFDSNNRVVPDVFVLCDRSKIKTGQVEGAPDLVIEVLSRSTSARDRNEKKHMYEKFGVKEFWVVDVANRTIDVFVHNGKQFTNGGVFSVIPDWEIEDLDESIRSKLVYEFSPSMFNDLVIKLDDVFYDLPEGI